MDAEPQSPPLRPLAAGKIALDRVLGKIIEPARASVRKIPSPRIATQIAVTTQRTRDLLLSRRYVRSPEGGPFKPRERRGFDRTALRRAVRAAIVLPAVFAFADKVIGNPTTTLFAVFGSFALLVLAQFSGPWRARVLAYLVLGCVGVGVHHARNAVLPQPVARRCCDGGRRLRRALLGRVQRRRVGGRGRGHPHVRPAGDGSGGELGDSGPPRGRGAWRPVRRSARSCSCGRLRRGADLQREAAARCSQRRRRIGLRTQTSWPNADASPATRSRVSSAACAAPSSARQVQQPPWLRWRRFPASSTGFSPCSCCQPKPGRRSAPGRQRTKKRWRQRRPCSVRRPSDSKVVRYVQISRAWMLRLMRSRPRW